MVNINEVELATELAHDTLVQEVWDSFVDESTFVSQDEFNDIIWELSEDGETYIYREEYQDMFNNLYDHYFEMIMDCVKE